MSGSAALFSHSLRGGRVLFWIAPYHGILLNDGKLILKFTPLVVQNSGTEPKPQYKVIAQLVSCCLSELLEVA